MLHLQTVTPALLKIIRAVSGEPAFADFRLVGGTALSLQLGHRLSVDADFFSEKPFDNRWAEDKLVQMLSGFTVLKASAHGFAGIFENVKLDLYTWNIPFLLPPLESAGMRLAALPDIAALKLASHPGLFGDDETGANPIGRRTPPKTPQRPKK